MLLSKRKRYLSGPDWVIGTLDYMMKAATCAGNMSQIVLLLESCPREAALRESLAGFVRRFPVLNGRVARDFKLTPYWKIPKKGLPDPILNVSRVDDCSLQGQLLPLLEQAANTPFAGEHDHLAFHFVTDAGRAALVMTFDHRLFDARGAESFLNLFREYLRNGGADGALAFTSSMALTQWMRKFLAGRTVNRRIIALSRSTPRALAGPPKAHGRYRFRVISLSEQETSRIYDDAYREAGYLLESPYLLAVVTRAVHEVLKGGSANGESYLIPVTIDLRPGNEPLQEIFFNHVSYLFYQVPAALAEDRSALIGQFKQQMYDQVKSGFPKDLAEASLLTRIAPLPLLGRLLHLPLKGRMATFVFSHLGRSSYQSRELLGAGIDALFHMPRVPVPPGLGFFSSYYEGRLSLVISHLDGMLSEADLRIIEQGILEGFGVRRPDADRV